MLRPVCKPCATEMHCKKNGVLVRTSPGMVRAGDSYECPKCGWEVITGFAKQSWPEDETPAVDLTKGD